MEVGEVDRGAVTQGSIQFQKQVSLPFPFSGATRSNKPSAGGLLHISFRDLPPSLPFSFLW